MCSYRADVLLLLLLLMFGSMCGTRRLLVMISTQSRDNVKEMLTFHFLTTHFLFHDSSWVVHVNRVKMYAIVM